MPPKRNASLIATTVADPAAYLFRCLEAQQPPFRVYLETQRSEQGLRVAVVDTTTGVRQHWHWRWARHADPAADRAAEDDAYRHTLLLLLSNKTIQPVA
jgi:hypothetical protein